eukprot:gb/GECH01000785.1/.p1 GENE.gb/GECH01000785.1/~~gb/GECH01000785.1/.p1  ORF type:complete len:395 (+),score=101.37 gb/GECH01000785.1/:1-1185(+)
MFKKRRTAIKLQWQLGIDKLENVPDTEVSYACEWRRGKKHSGKTQFINPDNEGNVKWNQTFNFSGTLFKENKSGKLRTKSLRFSILTSSGKRLGASDLDLSSYSLESKYNQTTEYAADIYGPKKSVMHLNFNVHPSQRDSNDDTLSAMTAGDSDDGEDDFTISEDPFSNNNNNSNNSLEIDQKSPLLLSPQFGFISQSKEQLGADLVDADLLRDEISPRITVNNFLRIALTTAVILDIRPAEEEYSAENKVEGISQTNTPYRTSSRSNTEFEISREEYEDISHRSTISNQDQHIHRERSSQSSSLAEIYIPSAIPVLNTTADYLEKEMVERLEVKRGLPIVIVGRHDTQEKGTVVRMVCEALVRAEYRYVSVLHGGIDALVTKDEHQNIYRKRK